MSQTFEEESFFNEKQPENKKVISFQKITYQR